MRAGLRQLCWLVSERWVFKKPCTLSLASVTSTKRAFSTSKGDPLIRMGRAPKKHQKIFSALFHRLRDSYSSPVLHKRQDHMLGDCVVPQIGYVCTRLPLTPASSEPSLRSVLLWFPWIQQTQRHQRPDTIRRWLGGYKSAIEVFHSCSCKTYELYLSQLSQSRWRFGNRVSTARTSKSGALKL